MDVILCNKIYWFNFFIFRIVIDYTQLPDNLKELDEPDDVKKMGDRLNRSITDLQNTIQRIQAPNMRVGLLMNMLM